MIEIVNWTPIQIIKDMRHVISCHYHKDIGKLLKEYK